MQIWQLFIKVNCDTLLPHRAFEQSDNKIKQVFFISTLREHSENRKDLQALTLVGPLRSNPKPAPLVVLHLDNRICMYYLLSLFFAFLHLLTVFVFLA